MDPVAVPFAAECIRYRIKIVDRNIQFLFYTDSVSGTAVRTVPDGVTDQIFFSIKPPADVHIFTSYSFFDYSTISERKAR